MIIKKGSTCYQSERGEKDKFYPDLTSMVSISRDEECERVHWIASSGLIPVMVLRFKMVLWCRPEDLS